MRPRTQRRRREPQSQAASDQSYFYRAAGAKLSDLRLGILRAEDGVASDESVCAGLPHRPDRLAVDAAVHFQKCLAAILGQTARAAAKLVHGALDEALTAETGIYGHDKQQVEIGDDLAHGRERRRRIHYRAGAAPELSNVIELTLKVR